MSACGTSQPTNPYDVLDVDHSNRVTIEQGIWGNVFFWEGGFGLIYGSSEPRGTITPVVRTIYVYGPTTPQEVEPAYDYFSSFHRAIHTTLVDSIVSDETGFFQLALSPGTYSIFLKEDNLFYGPFGGSFGLKVTVKSDSVTNVRLDITHKAVS